MNIRAFSIVELMVVLTILGVLAAAAVSLYVDTRKHEEIMMLYYEDMKIVNKSIEHQSINGIFSNTDQYHDAGNDTYLENSGDAYSDPLYGTNAHGVTGQPTCPGKFGIFNFLHHQLRSYGYEKMYLTFWLINFNGVVSVYCTTTQYYHVGSPAVTDDISIPTCENTGIGHDVWNLDSTPQIQAAMQKATCP